MGRKPKARPEQPIQRVTYTEEMRQRALERIRERDKLYPPDEVFAAYMQVMFRAFVRRLRRDHPGVLSPMMAAESPEVPKLDAAIERPRPKKLRRLKGETDEQRDERIRRLAEEHSDRGRLAE